MDNDEAVKEYNLTRLWDRTHNGLIINNFEEKNRFFYEIN